MDSNEFETRVFANPDDNAQDLLDALRDDPQRQQLLHDVQTFNEKLSTINANLQVPGDLAARLKSLSTAQQSGIASDDATAHVTPLSSPRRRSLRLLAMAAVLVLAVGLGFSTLPGSNQPSAAEIEFGQHVVSHVHTELDEIAARLGASYQQANEVFAAVGATIPDPQAMGSLGISMAKPCEILPQYSSAHLVMDGSAGQVNIIMVNNSPVSQQFNVSDARFEAVVIPLETGNLILVGEKNERFSQVQRDLDASVSWVI